MKRILRHFALLGFGCGNIVNNASPVRISGMSLTPRQRDVLELLWCGMSDMEIARTLDMSERTARIHVSVLLPMLQVKSRAKAATAALSWDRRYINP